MTHSLPNQDPQDEAVEFDKKMAEYEARNPSHDVLRDTWWKMKYGQEIRSNDIRSLDHYPHIHKQFLAELEFIVAHTEEKVREARIDELNKIADFDSTVQVFTTTLDELDGREPIFEKDFIYIDQRIKALTNKGKGDNDE